MRIAWEAKDPRTGTPNLAGLLDLGRCTLQERRIALEPNDEADPVVVAGSSSDQVVYTDAHFTDATSATWTIVSAPWSGGPSRVLARSATAEDYQLAPFPAADGDWVAWSQADPTTKTFSVQAVNLRQGVPHTVAKGTKFRFISVYQGRVYYERAGTGGKSDIWSAPADGSAPEEANTHSGDIAQSRVGSSEATWITGSGDQLTEWAQGLGSASVPVKLDASSGGNLLPCLGFAVWLSGDHGHLLANALPKPAPAPLVLNQGADNPADPRDLQIAARWACDGSLIVWSEETRAKGQARTHLRAVELTPS